MAAGGHLKFQLQIEFPLSTITASFGQMTLSQIEAKWRAQLATDHCPPVLGLVALSEKEAQAIRQCSAFLFSRYAQPAWKILLALLDKYPAAMSVWLAHEAGIAYEAGAFWDRFCEALGIVLPVLQRNSFAERFRRACRSVMPGWPQKISERTIL